MTAEALVQRLTTNQIDIAFLFEPPQLPEIVLDQMARIPLVMVSDQPGLTAEAAMQRGYVLVDWGSTFMLSHSRHFPDLPASALRVSQGGMALDLLRRDGGSAYLARQMAGDALDRGELHLVADAPVIERQAYAVYKGDSENLEALGDLLRLGVRKVGLTSALR